MPRRARQESCSGFFHVVVRGVGKQIIFEERSDYRYFLSILRQVVDEETISVCAYCLMDNHVHLLLFDECHHLPVFMKKIGIRYAFYYNHKYERTGHLFQDRYKSEPVETEAYLLTVLRYILKNPEKAGICPADMYEWSSYRFYGCRDSLVDTSYFSALLGDMKNYRDFISGEDTYEGCDLLKPRKTEKEAREVINRLGLKTGTAIQAYTKKDRNEMIMNLLREGLSIRQIERLTGVSRGIIQRTREKR